VQNIEFCSNMAFYSTKPKEVIVYVNGAIGLVESCMLFFFSGCFVVLYLSWLRVVAEMIY